ncbi:unnamed protein product [Cuscuta europaea]|uniref:Uncharacterized protein n=1 Tax=Cuscuta europaea TaxID=41803 RepID=A0A9P0ZQ03_CUSEU|nr:unnamed protein product [Cuscuta europaea]
MSTTNAYAGARSGGKIVNKRHRKFSTFTPYDRPPPPPAQKSPNWLTGVVFPATRTIVSGAAKLLSSVFDSDSSSCSSSSAFSHPDSNSIEEDDIKDDNDHDKDVELLKETECAATDGEHSEGMSKSKCLIEQLLMRETFSRAECERFINLINSRSVDSPTLYYGLQDAIPDGTTGTLNACSQAITEAREWLKNKKEDLHIGPCLVDQPISFITENMEKVDGSPIYVAKSYMKARPPWASPSAEHETRTPSMKSKLFDKGTPFPDGVDSTSSSRKKNALASGSWNIHEEIRRVRSKATNDMLHSPPAKRIDLPLLSEQKMKRKAFIDSKLTTAGDMAVLATDIGLSEIRQVAGECRTVLFESSEAQDNERAEVAGVSSASESHHHSGPVLTSENVDVKSVPSLEVSLLGGGEQQMQIDAFLSTERLSNDVRVVQVKCDFLTEASLEVPNFENEQMSSGT